MALINDFLSLIYPRPCEACGNTLFKHERFICHYCKLHLPKSNYHKKPENALHTAFMGRVPLVYALPFYVFEKSGRVQKMLHAIKYRGQKELGEYLGQLYGKELYEHITAIDVVVPVPLHKKKLKMRGYNQSEWFAKGLASGLNTEINTTSLERSIETGTQTKKKKYERWENVEGIFELKNKAQFANKHILLTDDVITTGATIEAAWQAFKDIDGVKISAASIAFTHKM
ncbi:MAG: ComF family protein [Bacteroidetes bacterium]|nr:ComF family protein [Bacteroidota bacterium]